MVRDIVKARENTEMKQKLKALVGCPQSPAGAFIIVKQQTDCVQLHGVHKQEHQTMPVHARRWQWHDQRRRKIHVDLPNEYS